MRARIFTKSFLSSFKGAMKACEKLMERLEPVRASMENPTWEALVEKAYFQYVDLVATHM
jgi:hypothetical protein